MKEKFKFLLLFFTAFVTAQEIGKDTLSEKYKNLETVIINDKDYEKINYSYGLKQENNVRFIPIINFEKAVKFNNNLRQKGRISNVVIFLHKTESKINLTNLEINFYKIDSLTGRPGEKINVKQIIYTPKSKSRGKVSLNVLDYKIPFPMEGVFVAIKWLPNEFNDKKVGPCLRETDYEEKLTYWRFKDGKWNENINISRKPGIYTNAMIGLEVYIKKRKNNE